MPADTYTGSLAFTDTGEGTTGSSSNLLLYSLLGLALLCAIAVSVFFRRRQRVRYHQQVTMRALKVMMPKPNEDEQGKRDPKELLAVMEPVFAALQHFYSPKVANQLWRGQPTFSFEIVAHDAEVFFYALAPEEYLGTLERQIHAQYPAAHIEPALDHDIFLHKGTKSAVSALALRRAAIFPIRTYKGLENDPLNALTNTLSKVGIGSQAAIQILVQPTDQRWQGSIEKALENIQQGKDYHHRQGLWRKTLGLLGDVGKTIFSSHKNPEDSEQTEAHNAYKTNVRLTAVQEQQAKLMVEKGGKIGFRTQIRVVARAATDGEATSQLQSMLAAFSHYQAPESNGFRTAKLGSRRLLVDYVLRSFSPQQPTFILNTEELTSLFHFPSTQLDTPNIHWLGARRLAPPNNLPKSGLLLGHSQFRGAQIPVYIQEKDRMRHIYMIGQTGTGKTTLFQNMIIQDIRNGHGVCYMDPNGDAVEWILRRIPKERAEDVIYFNPADTARPMALNLLEYDPAYPEQKTMVINEIISIFDKLYDLKATGGPIFEQYMRNAALLIMEDPESGSTLMEIPKVLADAEFRKMKLSRCKNQVVVDFWVKEAEKAGGEAALANIVPYITSKLTQFTSSDIMRPIVGQQKSAFNFRELMDQKKILLVSLPKGLLGDMSASLLGMIISGKIQIAAFSRQNQLEEQRTPFYLYVDEFQNFTSKTFATILSEARKYKLSLNITHQFIEQLDDETKNAVFGNVGTMLSYRIGAPDAEFMTKIFEPLQIRDMVTMDKYNYYIRLLIDSAPSEPFNALAESPDPHENLQIGEAVRQLSRLKFGRDREVIESEIRMRSRGV